MKTATELIEQAEDYCDEQWGGGEIVAQQAYIAGYQQALEDMRVEIVPLNPRVRLDWEQIQQTIDDIEHVLTAK